MVNCEKETILFINHPSLDRRGTKRLEENQDLENGKRCRVGNEENQIAKRSPTEVTLSGSK